MRVFIKLLTLILFILGLSAQAKLVSVSIVENAAQLVLSSKADYSLVQGDKTIYNFKSSSETLIKPGSITNDGKTYLISGEFGFKSNELFTVQRDTSEHCSQVKSESDCKQAHRFRGSMIVRETGNGLLRRDAPRNDSTLQLINRLELEDYLKSVVSSEMPSRWPLEALKAQAVCARTYTLNALKQKDILRSGVEDQMYLGYDREDDKGRKAVMETNGEVLVDSFGNYVDAYYSSSGGNYTASVSDVWGLSPRPYLLPVNDSAAGSSYQSWTRDFSLSDLESKLSDLRLNKIDSITVFQRSIEGRATKLQVLGTQNSSEQAKVQWRKDNNGDIFDSINLEAKSEPKTVETTRYLTGEELRHKLGLPSTNFDLSRQADKYIFTGTGFGHGIGMTQYGARNMAEAGADYREILEHYYQAAKLYR